MSCIDDLPYDFMGRNGCWDEDHSFKPEGLLNLFCSPEMTQVDGIEGPSEEPNPFILKLPSNRLTSLIKCKSKID